jgi:hypothetical protein
MQKRLSLSMASLTAIAWSLSPGHASAASVCATDVTNLDGTYATLITGGSLVQGTAKYQTGVTVFDGAGNVSGTNAYGAAGNRTSITGTYVQNADCTYTVDFTSGVLSPASYTIALDDSGQAVGIEVDAAAVANIWFKPQSSTPGANVTFNASSLNGTYALTCSGPLSQSSDVNLVTFNNGSLSGTDPYNNGGTFATSNVPYSGTYSVNADGTFNGSLTVTGTNFFFYGAIAPATNELLYIYENASKGQPIDSFAGCLGATALSASGGGTGGGGAFTLSPSQPTLQVTRGKSHSRHIAVTPSSGFTGTVTFIASGQPSGVTVSFSPASSPSGTSMNIAVANAATPGNYPITVTGSSPGVAAQTTTVTLIAK